MHILLIGLGNMGKKYLSKLEEMGKLPVLCDRDPNKAVGSYPFYCHFEEVKEPVKAVIVAVDPAEHVRLAKFFLENGASVLLEKPPALSKKGVYGNIPLSNALYFRNREFFIVP
jgi:UDP-N-acetylglucosamine 3-dehydrogenase